MQATQSPPDSAQSAKLFAEVAERSGRIMADFLRRRAGGRGVAASDEFGIARVFMDFYAGMLAGPWTLAEMQAKMFWDQVALWQTTMRRMLGKNSPPVAEPAADDNRFRGADWRDQFLFDYIKQSYLIAARHMRDAVSSVEGLPEETQKKVNFYTRQYIDALSPSNFALTNPQVLRETLQSGGQNLVRGLNNLLADIERGGIRMTDEKAFKLGVNVATTPGKVVFQNDLMQLIQYAPSTEKVFKRPLLVIPPWINKYYILDLREKNSFVRWAVGEGHTVFVISWVNPDGRYAGKSFDDYMFEGPLEHVVIEALAGVAPVRVDPGDDEHGVPLAHRPADEGILLAKIEDVVLVDPRRDDEKRSFEDLFRARGILYELHQVVLEHHLAGRRGDVHAELECLLVGHADAAALDVGEQIVQAADQILPARLQGLAQHLRVGQSEVRRRQRVDVLARVEIHLLLCFLRQALDGGDRVAHVARGDEVGLLDLVEQELVPPVRPAKAVVVRGGLGDGRRVLSQHAQHRRLPQRHVVPEHLRLHLREGPGIGQHAV